MNHPKKDVKIIDNNFAHAVYSSDYQESKYINWVRDSPPNSKELIFITDNSLMNSHMYNGRKIGWLMEPKSIHPQIYQWIKDNHNSFEYIITYDKELIEISENIIFYPHSGCWINPKDHKLYDKTKLLSIIASDKRMTAGHKLRHNIINNIKGHEISLDVYGRRYNPVGYKLEALKEYAFTIVIENIKYDYYFTEKLMDALTTGTIPIYWGCPSIGDFFNTDGMIIFDGVNDLLSKLESLSFDKYELMKESAYENMILAQKYLLAEDWLYENTNIFK
tara:strand:+ start:1517 stop:2347 length:831 start_codon:yes stop_codon:yes gene_type:complete